MAKSRQRIDDPRQISIFDVIAEAQAARRAEGPAEGALDMSGKLRVALNNALKTCNLSRHQIAGEMSHLTGTEISKAQIDSWTAESKDGHRFPAEYLPAFCRAVGSSEPLAILTAAAGLYALPGPDALRSEIQSLREKEKEISTNRRRREVFLQELEKRS